MRKAMVSRVDTERGQRVAFTPDRDTSASKGTRGLERKEQLRSVRPHAESRCLALAAADLTSGASELARARSTINVLLVGHLAGHMEHWGCWGPSSPQSVQL